MLNISKTGIRSGEKITSRKKDSQNSGTIMEIRGKKELVYPPNSAWVKNMTHEEVRDKMRRYNFFKTKTVDERKEWLEKNMVEIDDLYMEDVDMEVRFLNIGGKFMVETLGNKIDDIIGDGKKWWHIKDVYNMFPRKPNSRAKKHTLVFRPSNWVLMDDVEEEVKTGVNINIDNGKINSKIDTKYEEKIKTEKGGISVEYNTRRQKKLQWEDIKKIGKKNNMDEIKKILEWVPPSVHKSLIQKLIRTRCEKVVHKEKEYDAEEVLITSIGMLILHPGSFVPNIQKFVTGLESIKRIAISILEDSWTNDIKGILSLMTMSLLARKDKEWQPTDEHIENIFTIAVTAQKCEKIFTYDWHNVSENYHVGCSEEFLLLLDILEELKSFESDILMVKSICENKGKYRKTTGLIHMIRMPLYHCIDQHCFPEIGYKMPYTGESYDVIFKNFWNNCTGINPRINKYCNWNQEQCKNERIAQFLLWEIKSEYKIEKKITPVDASYKINFKISDQILAGAIGQINIKIGKVDTIVVLIPSEVERCALVAVRHPGRKTETDLTEEEKKTAVDMAINILKQGINIKGQYDHIPGLNGSTIYYKGDAYNIADQPKFYIKTNDKIISWKKFSNMSLSFKCIEYEEPSVEKAVIYKQDGVMVDADKKMKKIIDETDNLVLSRLKTFMCEIKRKICLNKLGRDGKGTEYTVLPEDILVDKLLCYICCLYPSALELTYDGYNVKNGPLLWHIYKNIINNDKIKKCKKWKKISAHHKLWEHQIDSLNRMLSKHDKGQKGHELWINVGMGKTAIVIEYIRNIINRGTMNDYCIWTLPPASSDNLITELKNYGIPYYEINSNKNELKKCSVGIVYHDRLRCVYNEIKQVADSTLFIVDEFHKTMNKTIRTSVTLELVKLCNDFVALSGTIIKGTGSYMKELFVWLNKIVDFDVVESNYMVAMSELISKKISTNIYVDREDYSVVPINSYYDNVPLSMGGNSEFFNFTAALKYSYESTLKHLIYLVTEYVKLGEKVFVAVKDSKRQQLLSDSLYKNGIKNIHNITINSPITLTPSIKNDIQVVITTKNHVEGYTLTDRRIAIYELFFANQSVYEQLDGRLNRIGQLSDEIRIITVHSGILSYIYSKYNTAQNMSKILKDFASEINMDFKTLLFNI